MKHCFKCNRFKRMVGGAMVMTGNGRKRFACACCLPRISNRPVLVFVAKPKEPVRDEGPVLSAAGAGCCA